MLYPRTIYNSVRRIPSNTHLTGSDDLEEIGKELQGHLIQSADRESDRPNGLGCLI